MAALHFVRPTAQDSYPHSREAYPAEVIAAASQDTSRLRLCVYQLGCFNPLGF